jgi:hypothetical protein
VLSPTTAIVPGWFITRRSTGASEYWHDGAFPGNSAVNIAIPGQGTFIAISARGGINAYLMAETILDELGL